MTTYGDLLAKTADHLRQGHTQLATDRFWTPGEALDAIGDFHGMLQAIAAHTRRLLWPAKSVRPGMNRQVANLSPTEQAAAHLATGIDALIGAATPHPAQLAPTTTPWRHAAMYLRAASDLLALHYRPDGSPRSPDAAATDARALDAGLAHLAHLTALTLSAEEPLALRALQAGVNKQAVAQHLPGLGHLSDLARTVADDTGPRDLRARAPLGSFGATVTPIRVGDSVTELGDRMQRLRQTTWDLTATPGDALATLRDVTTIGIAIHAHTAAFHGAQPMTAAEASPAACGAQALLVRGRAWQSLHQDLSHFLTLAPPIGSVRDDLTALARLLPALAPLDAPTSRATRADPASRRIGAALNGAVATMTDIAQHTAVAFTELAETGALRLKARDLPRDLVSADPVLASDRLRGALVHPPEAVLNRIRAGSASSPITLSLGSAPASDMLSADLAASFLRPSEEPAASRASAIRVAPVGQKVLAGADLAVVHCGSCAPPCLVSRVVPAMCARRVVRVRASAEPPEPPVVDRSGTGLTPRAARVRMPSSDRESRARRPVLPNPLKRQPTLAVSRRITMTRFPRMLSLSAAVTAAALATAGCSAADDDAPPASTAGGQGDTSWADVQEAGVLVVGTEGTYRPFSFHEEGSGDLVGYDVEVIEAVAEELGVDVQFEETQWDAIFAGLEAGRFDLIANQVSITPEREEAYTFTEPYTVSNGVVVVRADEDSIDSFESLDGKVTAQSLTSNWKALAEESGAQIEAVEGWAQAVALVEQERVDATINDELTFLDYAKNNDASGLKVAAETEEQSFSAFALAQGRDELARAIDEALATLAEDGTLAEISEKYFGDDVSR